MNPVKARVFFFDNAKFLLIFFVILGHCLARLGDGRLCASIDASVYFFHMPLFVFISGYFTRLDNTAIFGKDVLRIFETFLVFSVIHTVLAVLVWNQPLTLSFLLEPRWSLWYLLSLCVWRIVARSMKQMITKPLFLLASFILGVMFGFVPVDETLSIQRTFSLFPFFVAGCCSKSTNFFSLINRIPLWLGVAVLCMIPVITYSIDFPFKKILEGKYSYYRFDYPLWLSFLYRILFYCGSMIASICLLRVIPKKEIPWISEQGADSLYYYLYHTLLIYLLLRLRHYIILSRLGDFVKF